MKDRHVNIMTAGVHDMDFFAFVIFGDDFARIRQTGFLLHWQCIEIGAHKHGRPVAVLHHADNAVTFQVGVFVFAQIFGDLAAGRVQFLCDDRRGALLMPG